MKNDTKSILTITMHNVDHAVNLEQALRKFFACTDAGGDAFMIASDGYDQEQGGMIGHDVRKPEIDLKFYPEK